MTARAAAAATLPLRRATPDDVPALDALIASSARVLSAGFYSPRQTEAAIAHMFGVDSQLVADGTYYLIEGPDGPAAAGGWSRHRSLYGGDQMAKAEEPLLDPAVDAARIRAFFVHPQWARCGLATRLYDACEAAARAAGFHALELMATAPGEPLYRRLGFAPVEPWTAELPGGVRVPFLRMRKAIGRG